VTDYSRTEIRSHFGIKQITAKAVKGDYEILGGFIHSDIHTEGPIVKINAIGGDISGSDYIDGNDMDELIELRMADRIGSGVPKAEPYKLRHLRYLIEKVSQDPLSTKMLAINGNEIIKLLQIQAGPRIGYILNILLGLVLENPEKNKKEILEKEVKKLGKLEEDKLINLSKQSIQKRKEVETKRDDMTKKKYWVT